MGPTEIVVTITTNACPELRHADVYVNGQHVTQAPQPACVTGDDFAKVEVGKITLLPSHGLDGKVDVTIVGDVGGSCDVADPNDPLCIVARRSLSFIPHGRIDLPILLDNACTGVHCSGNETCVVDETGAHCTDSTCGKFDGPVCSNDGGGVIDAGGPDVITIDAGPPACPTILPASLGPPTFSWTFDTVSLNIAEDNNAFTATSSSASIVTAAPSFCDNPYLHSPAGIALASAGNTKFTMFSTKSFVVGFAFFTGSPDVALLSLSGSSTQATGFAIAISTGSLVVNFGGNLVYVSPTILQPKVWHRFGLEVTTIFNGTGNDQTTITPYLDGTPGTPKQVAAYVPGTPLNLSVGQVDVDSISYYSK